VTSIVINITVALLIVIVGAIVKTNPIVAKRITELTLPPEPPKVAPVPKPPPPPPPKPLPTPPRVETPKVKLPEPVKVPDIKPVIVPVPKPVVPAPAPPKAVTPPPAPVKVNLANAQAAHVVNNDAHPTAVRLGQMDNPLRPLNGPAVARVNFGQAGAPGMSGSGSGPHATNVSLGSGSPNGSMDGHDNASRPVAGVRLGVPGGTGPMNSKNYSNAPVNVQLQAAAAPVAVKPKVETATAAAAPKVVFKPTPEYTAEAKAIHLEGDVSVRIRVLSSGAVQVLGVTHGLGHGLDQSAVQAVEGTRFRPALDAEGHPIDWEGVVRVNFQLS
jgi:TonB family protein